eukprot:m.289675 g.289675  ORF g.289675 m.289675 type:complete len:236 (-) comp16376_c3_seq10:352-1059(-)
MSDQSHSIKMATHSVTSVLMIFLLSGAKGEFSCKFKDHDYSPLTNDAEDYVVQSEFYPNYEFIFNVCRQTIWTDDECPSGSGMCERLIESHQATDIYGLFGTAEFSEDSSGVYIEMTTANQYPCMFGGDMQSRIYFACDQSAKTPIISIKKEDYYECLIHVQISSEHACSGNPAKFKCIDNKCVEDADGMPDIKACDAVCGVPKYRCIDNKCVESEDGDKYSDCTAICGRNIQDI